MTTTTDPTCRFCCDDGNSDDLVSPCECKGTIEFVHRACLTTWVNTSGHVSCDMCKYKYERGFVGFKPPSEWTIPDNFFTREIGQNQFWNRIYALWYGIFAEVFLLRLLRARGTNMLQLAFPAIRLSWWVSVIASILFYMPLIHESIAEEIELFKELLRANMIYEWKNKPKAFHGEKKWNENLQ